VSYKLLFNYSFSLWYF